MSGTCRRAKTGRALGAPLVLLVLLAAGGAASAEESACVACHSQLAEHLLVTLEQWQADVHAEAGLGCHGCHGGDPRPELVDDAQASMSPEAGFVGKPDRLRIAEFCGKCHADPEFMKRFDPGARVDQLAEYRTSVHGKRQAQGDPVPATCTDCHGIHGIRGVKAPDSPVSARNVPETCARCHADATVMEPYGIPTDQYDLYLESEHAAALLVRGDTGAPACNDCHGNHGAAPPGVASVAYVCGQCHVRESQLFRASFKKDLFDAMDVTECSVCHGNHRILHPTSELFRSDSSPTVSRGTVSGTRPLRAGIGDLGTGESAEASWTVILSPHLAEGGGQRTPYRVSVTAAEAPAVVVELPLPGVVVTPGASPEAENDALAARLAHEPLAGPRLEPGGSARLTLAVTARQTLSGVEIRELPAPGVNVVEGSVCMQCHAPGDECDVATGKMYEGLRVLNSEYGEARILLHRAEVAGMAVGDTMFALNTQGKTAVVEAKALIHAFDPERSLEQIEKAREPIATALEAARAAMAELQYRRKGLAVSLVLIALVALGLFLKIRQLGPGY